MRLIDADAFKKWLIDHSITFQEVQEAIQIGVWIDKFPSAQPELIEKTSYIRGFEQGRTQGMIDSQGRKKGENSDG